MQMIQRPMLFRAFALVVLALFARAAARAPTSSSWSATRSTS